MRRSLIGLVMIVAGNKLLFRRHMGCTRSRSYLNNKQITAGLDDNNVYELVFTISPR